MTTTVDVKTAQLPELLALTRAGNDVLLTEGDVPVARLTAVAPVSKKRVLGLHPGAITTTEDFDDPLPDEFWLGEDK